MYSTVILGPRRLTQQLDIRPRVDGRLHADFHKWHLQHSLNDIGQIAGKGRSSALNRFLQHWQLGEIMGAGVRSFCFSDMAKC